MRKVVFLVMVMAIAVSDIFSQNVGVNTNTPASTLDVKGNLTVGPTYSGTAAPTGGAIIEGNVGIGTVSLGAYKLYVNGNTNIVGTATISGLLTAGGNVYPTTTGSSGQVLQTNGSGTLGWTTPATGTVTSVSGTAPISSSGGTAPSISISQSNTSTNGYLSSTDWNTFNSKIGGSGTTSYIPKWSSSSTLTNSLMYDNGVGIGIGTTSPSGKLQVVGDGYLSRILTTGNNVVTTTDPLAADIVVGSSAGTRHDGSIMWWSNSSASRISNTSDVFYMSVWNTATPNVALAAAVGGSSYFQGNVGIGTTSPSSKLQVIAGSVRITGSTNTNAETGGMLIYDNTSGLSGNTTKVVVSRKVVVVPSAGSFNVAFSDFNITLKVGYDATSGAYVSFIPVTNATNWNYTSIGSIYNTSNTVLDPYSTSGLAKVLGYQISSASSSTNYQITPWLTSVSASGVLTYLSSTDSQNAPSYVINSQTVSTSSSGTKYMNVIVTAYY